MKKSVQSIQTQISQMSISEHVLKVQYNY